MKHVPYEEWPDEVEEVADLDFVDADGHDVVLEVFEHEGAYFYFVAVVNVGRGGTTLTEAQVFDSVADARAHLTAIGVS